MRKRHPWILLAILFSMAALACRAASGLPGITETLPTTQPVEVATPTALPPIPVKPGAANPEEPVFITGEIPYTSPFFLNTISEPFVLLEDQGGFVQRDREFQFQLSGQVIGAVEVHDDDSLTYSLALPAIPQGTLVNVANNGQENSGVQIFAVAYWSNTWGGPFLEERDGSGWSSAYASTIVDPANDDEIQGGILIVWAPDENQYFPTSFGEDGMLFTEDDPTGPIPPGYNIVDLNQEPFQVYKETQPNIDLNEGVIAVNDFSDRSYAEAFKALFEKASREYPFTAEKGIMWQELFEQSAPRFEQARNPNDFYRALRDFTYAIPDAHVGLTFNAEVFNQEHGGGFGLVLTELSDERVIAAHVLSEKPAEKAGIQEGAEILTWNNQPIAEAISQVIPYFGPFSTQHSRRLAQAAFITRVPPNERVTVSYRNPGDEEAREVEMRAENEYDSLFLVLPGFDEDVMALPVQGEMLPESGLGYVRISTFSDDYHIMAQLWDHYLNSLVDNSVPGLIIDMRQNSGGSSSLAMDFAGYFFDEEIALYRGLYYNETLEEFKYSEYPTRIRPGPLLYEGPVAVLVSPDCISACEGFTYALKQGDRSIVVGHYPTAGAYGEVGRGQYKLPEDISLQFPTGRPETLDGNLLIEGVGVIPDITVPVSEESALDQKDAVLEAAIQALMDKIP